MKLNWTGKTNFDKATNKIISNQVNNIDISKEEKEIALV